MSCRCGSGDCAIVQFTATQDTVTWSPIERIVETQASPQAEPTVDQA